MSVTRILVTGASGFVGGRFVARFRDRPDLAIHGIGRRALDDPAYSSIDLSQPFDVLSDPEFRPDVVIHGAARATPWGTLAEYRRDNVEATRQVIDYCLRNGRPRLVYVSSSSVLYRDGPQLGLTEAAPVGPKFVNRYAATKAEGERLVQAYSGPWLIARPRAVFGPGDTVLFPRILAAAKAGKLPLFNAGAAGPAIGDLIYVDTLGDYLLAAALRTDLSGVYHLTNARPVPIQALLLDLFARLGLPAPRRKVSVGKAMFVATILEGVWGLLRLSGEPPITRFGVGVFAWSKTFDVSKALADLGPPSVSLEEGIDAFVRWQLAQERGS
ncbi:MAG TPA: NAD-dependent epimerase/dehydratase family protein [Thermoanaerobaculia bacterium]|nr:NAD-dependent epimerase/dehydratase family protein [Thermoanaerobaculia bacterium]